MSIDVRFVIVDTETSEAWKFLKIQALSWKRCWKYGPAARNMFQAQSMETPRRRNML
jgi:hypothetical protein